MPVDALSRAQIAWLSGNDNDAELLLMQEREAAVQSGSRERLTDVDLATARFALAIDDDERVELRLLGLALDQATADQQWEAWACASRLKRRGRGSRLPEPSVPPQSIAVGNRVALEVIRCELDAQAVAAARALVEQARPRFDTSPEPKLAFLRVDLQVLLAAGELPRARAVLLEALELSRKLKFRRIEGRLLVLYALEIAPHLDDEAHPALWLGRAQSCMAEFATFRDRAALRSGFRQFGRRLPDSALASGVAARVDALEGAAAALRGVVVSTSDVLRDVLGGAEADDRTAKLVKHATSRSAERVGRALRVIEQVGSDLTELIGVALADRDRMQRLTQALAALDSERTLEAYATSAARVLGGLLDADRVVIALADEAGGEPRLLGYNGAAEPEELPDWRRELAPILKQAPSLSEPAVKPLSKTRAESAPYGPRLTLPVRAPALVGALYVDKIPRNGTFRDSDYHLASVFAEAVAQALSRVLSEQARERARDELAAVVGALKEGVLSLDPRGTVKSANPAAARLLQRSLTALPGSPLAEVAPVLADLTTAGEEVEGRVVTVDSRQVVVTLREIAPAADAQAGWVMTLMGLEQAQRMAIRVTSAGARRSFEDIVGRSASLTEALDMARRAARVNANILITGESGTGKEVLAQAIHTSSPRGNEPFIGINCAALPRDLLEAELFGYERGAFTGARREGAAGKFEQAGAGTILLDEIGDMPLDMQVKMLRVLQERVVVRLGGATERPVPCRVIATTHRDLDDAVAAGRFRADLLFRLRVIHLQMPPLRERSDDIPALVEKFLADTAEAQGRPKISISAELQNELKAYCWPGNVRELANVVEREVSLLDADSTVIDELQVPLEGTRMSALPEPPSSRRSIPPSETRDSVIPLADVERRVFLDALRAFEGSVSRAAKALKVSKVTFYSKLKRWGVDPKRHSDPGPESTAEPGTDIH
ncbi:MAG: sigma 54-interacting transcriptional regulator [Polyangiaceae bacterium]|nr:sigma 54-interacting transcriptional regulator [Polyangiaceae bacterium]